MPNEPETIGEIARLLRQLSESNREQFNSVNSRLDKLVSAEVHQIYVNSIDRRIDDLFKALAEERAARTKAVSDEATARKEAATANATRMDRMGAWVRAIGIGMLVPVALFVMTLVFNNSGT